MRVTARVFAPFMLSVVVLASVGLARQNEVPPAVSAPQSNGAPTEAQTKPLRFAVVGDTGTGDAMQYAISREMVAAFDKQPYEFVLMVGDNTYSSKCADFDRYFDAPYKDLLDRKVAFYATLGNHDQKCAETQLSHPKLNMGGKRWYSFAPAGELVEFFTFDSTVLLSGRMLEQLDWLDRSLAASRARWKIAFFHHPPYSPGSRHGDDPMLIAKVLPILKRHGVRIVLTGHEHFFARIGNRDGIEYIISGSGGKIHRKAIDRRYPGFVAGNDEAHQFLTVTLTPESFAFTVNSDSGTVLYQETIPFAATPAAAAAGA